MEKEIKITPPEGFEIDRENSTFECIKFKPKHERWRDQNNAVTGYYLNGDDVRLFNSDDWDGWNGNHDVFATKKQAKSAFAMAQISQIIANDERFGGVVADEEWNTNTSFKYIIERYGNNFRTDCYYNTHHFLAFHTREQRDLFLEENKDLIKDYLMID